MAEVTERDREAARRLLDIFANGEMPYWTEACVALAAYRESCVAESEAARQTMAVAMQEAIDREVAARLKAEGERDETQRQLSAAELEATTWLARCHDADCEGLKNLERAEEAEARLRAVIEERDTLLRQRAEYNAAFSSYRRVRDAQASPEPEASKQVEHEFKLKSLSLTAPSECAICGLPWSRHGGRDAR